VFVIDSSIFSSIIVKDEFYGGAEKFLMENYMLENITVDLAYVEVANTLWKHVYVYKRIPYRSYGELKKEIKPLISNSVAGIYKTIDVLQEALDNAVKYGITVYDSTYVTLALKHNYKLASFDQKLREKLEKQGLNIVYIP